MATAIDIVGQRAMDVYYQTYKSDSDFFDLEDFIFHAGSVLGEYYRQLFTQQYQMLRNERLEELVSFSDDALNEQTLKVELKNQEHFAVLKKKVMGFDYDKCNAGIQHVFAGNEELERSSLSGWWQLKLTPTSERIFWRLDRDKIKLFNKLGRYVTEIRVLYVPAIGEDMEVPDSLVQMVINTTVAAMQEYASGKVVKKSNNQNQNKVLESEIDKAQLKQ